MVPGRTEKASKGRYHKILKKHVVPLLEQADALRSPSATRARLETRLANIQGLQLPYLTRQSLVQLHFTASNLTNHTTDSWSIEEDAYLLAARLSGKRPQDAKLPPREPARTIRAMRRTFRRPFPSSWRPPRSEMPKRVARVSSAERDMSIFYLSHMLTICVVMKMM